ncbi:MAG: hypothetical protein JXR76_28165 [Deltaproteobacteria bacterium]|nr:hypothetical protein [Deltaproteobacteria bacterium]
MLLFFRYTLQAVAVVAWGCSGPVVNVACDENAERKKSELALQSAEQSFDALYLAAVADAAVAEESELHDLKIPQGEDVDVLSWVKNEYLDSYPTGSIITLPRYTWVTLPPEVQEKCQGYAAETQMVRLQQLLGLPPQKDGPRSFVVLSVKRDQLFRPCILPDVAAPQCTVFEQTDDDAHALFFANQTAVAYTTSPGYPWTRLGYTYDWNPDTPEYGVTEFVIKIGAQAVVKTVVSTEQYCVK